MKFTYKLICILLFTICGQAVNGQMVHTGAEASKKFNNAELVRDSKFSSLPSYIQFKKSAEINIHQLEQWMNENFELEMGIGFKQIQKDVDKLGHVHYRYQQTFNGIPIQDAIWIAHTNMDQVYSLNGLIYKQIESPKAAGISEMAALDYALQQIGADLYKWQLPGEEAHLKWETGDPEATYKPKGELVFVSRDYSFDAKKYTLAYKFNIYAQIPLSKSEIYMDAVTGEIIRVNNLICHADELGTAHTGYSGEREMIADSFEGTYRLRDGSRGDGIRTFDMNQTFEYDAAEDFIDDDNDWNNINPELDEYATDAHWATQQTYDYYLEIHDRNSIDNEGFQLNSYVHCGVNMHNAFWDGFRMSYGDGDVDSSPLTTLDVVGHEVTHGLTNYTADLIYSAESGALNESFSDIFGTTIEAYSRPADWDWYMTGEVGYAFRNMANPNEFEDPDTYFGDFWAPLDGGDEGGVHTNSGVQNFWYYLLVDGGSGVNDNGDSYAVSGIGMDAAAAIAFRNLTVYLTPSSQYEDARFFSILAATDLYGGCTFETEQTTEAWYAVGLGEPYSEEVVAHFSTEDDNGCALPFTVDFTNESTNIMTCLWDFGDGETSTEITPSHTYTTEGLFDVSLSIDGGACGNDEITFTDFIAIELEADCPIVFPATGIGPTLTHCEGTLYDSGGIGGDYGKNEDGQITISPPGAMNVELSFFDFDVDWAWEEGCVFDFLTIYDGPTTSDPVIGVYCNAEPPGVITSTGPSITLAFHSDIIYQFRGFQMYWTCTGHSGLPESDTDFFTIFPNPSNGLFTASFKTNMQGSIEVTDMLGKRIMSVPINGNSAEIDLTNAHAKGIYFLNVLDSSGQQINTQRVVVY